MQEMFIGDVIKQHRQNLKLTQSQLCEGICEPITISRLENGKNTTSYNRIKALLERLDMPTDRFFALLNKDELEIESLYNRIVACNLRFEHSLGDEKHQARAEALQAHRELEAVIDKDDTVSRQMILYSRVILGKDDGPYSLVEERNILLEAIHLTHPAFDLDDIAHGLYTSNEIKIINLLGCNSHKAGDSWEAVRVWEQLYRYIHKHLNNAPSAQVSLNLVLFNYATGLWKIRQYQKAIEIAEEGRQSCLNSGHYASLSGMMEVMADCYRVLGDTEKSKEYYYQAYYLSKATGQTFEAGITRRELKVFFNLEPEC